MAYDRSDVRKVFDEARRRDKAAERERTAVVLKQAQAHADVLTGHPAWDIFLSQVQAMVEEEEARCAAATERLTDPRVVETPDILAAKSAIAEARGAIAMGQRIMALPRELVEKPL